MTIVTPVADAMLAALILAGFLFSLLTIYPWE